jgi:hypothetical protein
MRAILRGRIADLHAELRAHRWTALRIEEAVAHVVAQLRRQLAHFARGGFQSLLRFGQCALGLRLCLGLHRWRSRYCRCSRGCGCRRRGWRRFTRKQTCGGDTQYQQGGNPGLVKRLHGDYLKDSAGNGHN